ncbi:hypothetical protein TNCV_164981 [Trichonephila clavipes]|nr:hypothetical protein TNCV_164981 [Trichonephila clavipes]
MIGNWVASIEGLRSNELTFYRNELVHFHYILSLLETKRQLENLTTDPARVQYRPKLLTSLGNGMPSIPPSHIEMYLSLEVERPGLRGSFQIGGLEGATKCSCGDCFGDIRCDGNFSE